ncbi:MAG: energy-coupling factor ABC transporter ATP-binding protein [Chloroflexota bacterium]
MRKTTPALNITNLQFAYPDSPPVLTGLDLTLDDGERVGLIGPNGAGKTTLFMLICGVLKPVAGEVLLYDNSVKPGKFHPEVGLVFQYPNEQLFSPSVRDDIAFGPLNMGLPTNEVEERVNTAMQQTGIDALADRAPHHLSGGQKRMVAIAGIQAMQPKLVIYDEPGANLDMRSRRRLINYLQASDETVFVASHDLELVLEVCPRVVLLDEGRIIADGDAREIMGDVALMEAHGLERPHSLMPHHTGEIIQTS